MSRRWQFALVLVSLLVGLVTLLAAYERSSRFVTTIEIVVPARAIPPYTMLTAADLMTRSLPRALVQEAIYLRPSDVIGRITTIPLTPGLPIYYSHAVPSESFRLADDPTLEVVSFPIDPARAAGGQIRPGQRINVYRAVLGAPPTGLDADSLLARPLSAAKVLASAVLVVDVRSSQGQAVRIPDQTSSSGGSGSSQTARVVPLQVITVAVPPDVALELVRLATEDGGRSTLWVSLAPALPAH